MLRKIRIAIAIIFFVGITLLFLDFTGVAHTWFGWMAKIQFLPAVLALNIVVIAFLAILTIVFGRVYCSVICPLGIMQDIFSWGHGLSKKGKFRFSYSKPINWLRYGTLALFIVAMLLGSGAIASIIAPYSAYGRIASNLLQPIWRLCNNALAYFAERADSYAFYSTDVWIKSLPTFIVAAATFVIIGILAWIHGRAYCNTICPVGTTLGFLSRFSIFGIKIDKSVCNGCTLCSRRCKSSCIDPKKHKVDYSRCVACMDCIGACRSGAISYGFRYGSHAKTEAINQGDNTEGRRRFIAIAGATATAAALHAQMMKVDGGLAVILDKKPPKRETPIVPPGAISLKNLSDHCTACQLCVSACPNDVLRPSASLDSFMQPQMSYERGYCRPECTKCSQVCPAGAIRPIDSAEKTEIHIGHAVWVRENCLPVSDSIDCGNCARHCPVGAITMVPIDPSDENSKKRPAINGAACIGCGACENLCPSRPFSAIYVEGHSKH